MTTRSIRGRNALTGETITLSLSGGVITAMEPGGDGDIWIAPGLVDLQINGFAGIDLNSVGVTANDVVALTRALRATGVTTYLPTLITASDDRICAALSAIHEARRIDPATRHAVPFIHLEGPWISPQDGPRGAHPAADVRAPDLVAFKRWQDLSGGLIGLVTLSPHWPDSDKTIAALTRMGVHVSIGHTHADAAQITAAIDAGARFSTHLGNGIAAMLPRHPNAIWTQLADDRLTRMFIADGHHLSAPVFKTMLRAVGMDNAVLVSDVVAIAGLPPGTYDSPIGGRVELAPDGRLSMAGTAYLAGAATALVDTLPRAMTMAGISLADAFRLAARNPGRIVGGRGELKVGGAADIILFRWREGDERLTLIETLTSAET